MLTKLQSRLHNEEKGFTLVELLVVILIIGILAAIAIPSFLSQTDKAQDAQSKSGARNAQTAAETFNVDSNGDYTGMTAVNLTTIEPTLADAGTLAVVAAGADTYEISMTNAETGNVFSVERLANGTVDRTCTATGTGGCPSSGIW